MKVIAVKHDETRHWIDRLDWHFREFEKNEVLSAPQLWADIREKQRQLFVVVDQEVKAVVLTRIADDEAQSCVVTHAAGYDRPSWQHLWRVLEGWAASIGCKRIEAITRPGWERILKDFQMKKTHVVLEKDL